MPTKVNDDLKHDVLVDVGQDTLSPEDSSIDFVSSDQPIRQGDVLYWQNSDKPFEQAGVIVTGDCDIANAKHWGKISIVPIISADSFVEHLFAPKKISCRLNQLTERFSASIKAFLRKEGRSEPSIEMIDALLSDEKIPEALSKCDDILFLHLAIGHARGVRQGCCNKDMWKNIENIFMKESNDSILIEKMRNAVQSHLSNPPGDLLVSPKIEGLPFRPAIVWLRIIREITELDISLKSSELKANTAVRLGRLKPTIRYKVTQKLAQVFSDIGLPSSFENETKEQISCFSRTVF